MPYVDEEGNVHYTEDFRPLLEKIKQQLLEYYLPVTDIKEADLHLSTKEIFEQLHKLSPIPILTEAVVSLWLNEGGFKFEDFGEMKFEWLLKKASD